MRRIHYHVACSLDGYIATADGGYDWIPADPDIDFAAIFAQFDVLLMGRKTYDLVRQSGDTFGKKIVVLSSSLRPEAHPDVTVLSGDVRGPIEALKREDGKDIWLFGGGETFRLLLGLGLVNGIELAVVPILLGGGIPFLPAPAPRATLTLKGQRVYPRSGIVMLDYDVRG
ncbi:MAG TPA: dihydrofolate reductase family protein [Longimicrobiales bacterium]|nr:dihydrofolate reductase family protein [Longimicrobiales bacterium]